MRCSHRDPAVRAHQQETQTWARHVALLAGQLPPGYPGRLETSILLPPSYHLQNPLPSSSQWARLPPRPLLLGTPVTLMAMTQDPTASRAHVVRSPGGMPSSIILPTTVSPVEPTVPGPAPHPVPGTSHHQYPPHLCLGRLGVPDPGSQVTLWGQQHSHRVLLLHMDIGEPGPWPLR